jgi:putative ABC transport system permease protein
MSLVIHTEHDAATLTEPVRQLIREIGPAIPLNAFRTMADIRANEAADREFPTVLLIVFSSIALTLAVVGVYGVVAFAASRRTFEIGIRMALGADGSEIRRMVVRNGVVPVVIGIVIGVAGAAAAAQTLRGLLYNVRPLDPLTLILVPAVIVVAALAASLVPALRASRVAPSEVLRSE